MSECICDDYFISSLVVDCVNVNVRAYVLQVGKSIVALLPSSIHFQYRPNCAIEFLLIL